VRVAERQHFQQYLLDNGIETNIHYPIPPHEQPAYKEINTQNFPISELIHKEIISLPLSPIIPEKDLAYIVGVINNY
jgi:dTDP-4-amino-4,6-dideoxygalactose transaminase